MRCYTPPKNQGKQLMHKLLIIFALVFTPYLAAQESPNIILISMPKSGSTFLVSALQNNLHYKRRNIVSPYYGQKNYNSSLAAFFATPSLIAKEHYRAPNSRASDKIDFMSPIEISYLKKYTNKIVIHARDPRQAMLSLVHHILEDPKSIFIAAELRPWFDTQTFYKKIDWGIDNLLPSLVAWLEDWMKLKDQEDNSRNGIKILVTTYDELISDDKLLYAKILDFYQIAHLDYIAPKKDSRVRYRVGNPKEWQSACSPTQQKRIAQIVPRDLLQRFGWE